jgi:hypothetical protein
MADAATLGADWLPSAARDAIANETLALAVAGSGRDAVAATLRATCAASAKVVVALEAKVARGEALGHDDAASVGALLVVLADLRAMIAEEDGHCDGALEELSSELNGIGAVFDSSLPREGGGT